MKLKAIRHDMSYLISAALLVVATVTATIGCVLGLISGYYGGRADIFIMRMADIQLAFPFVLLCISLMFVLGSGLFNIIVALGVNGWMTYARVIRGSVLSIKEKEYIEAARAIGARDFAIIFRHILPNAITPLLMLAMFAVPGQIIAEASLTFLGLGVEPAIPTWGSMISDGRTYIFTSWWMNIFPGLAILVTVLGLNLLGDLIRDVLDPHRRYIHRLPGTI